MTSFCTLEKSIREILPDLSLERDVPMSALTTLRLGGPADLVAQPGSTEELALLLKLAREENCPVTIIGRGSNLLVLDGGVRGLVIRMGRLFSGIKLSGREMIAESGAMLSAVSMAAAREGLSGAEFASGIPGTVGGAVMMNAGAYGGTMSGIVVRVEGIDLNGDPFGYAGEEMRFGYRSCRLRPNVDIVTRVTMSFTEGERDEIAETMRELNQRRAEKQPLNEASAGSTFKRPEGYYAGALIEQCGLKEMTSGGAAVSGKHAGFLVNRGGTAADFLDLIGLVQKRVLETTGVRLEPEIRIIGEDNKNTRRG